MRLRAYLIGAALAAGWVVGADAATVTDIVTFSANTFQTATYPGYTAAAPLEDPVTGSFIISFDPTQDYTDQSVGITLKSLNITLSSTLAFSYSTSTFGTFGPGTLRVGGLAGGDSTHIGSDTVVYAPSDNDFWLFIDAFSTAPAFDQVGYAQGATNGNLYYTIDNTGTVDVEPYVPPAIPELSTWAMTIAGFAGLGWLGYTRRRAIGSVAA